jgi:hypothetical protein
MKKLRFNLGRFWMNAGLWIMPFEAQASFRYNTNFLTRGRVEHNVTEDK